MSARAIGLTILGASLLAACMQDSDAPAPAASSAPAARPATPPPAAAAASAMVVPDRIVVERGGFIPEGIEYDNANHRFLTGSLAEGTIFEIHNDGRMTPVAEDPALVSSVGIEVDEARDRILVANSDRAVFGGEGQGQAKLGVYSLTTGERIAMVDLGATLGGSDDVYFANDVAVTDDGRAFITDTRMNVVYEVGTDYTPTVFYRFAPMEGLSLNGIVAHDDDYLIVVASSTGGMLYKVPIDNPSAAAAVSLSEPATGADGIVWAADGSLAAISNSQSNVLKYSSNDDWASATVTGRASFEGQATTGAAVGDDVYVVEPHFNDAEPPVILKATF